MSFRTVVIANRCKLDMKLGYLVVRGDTTKRVFLDEIGVIVIENPAVSITGCLIQELASRKIKVIFCDNKRNPTAELMTLHGSHDCSQKIRFQIGWSEDIKGAVWSEIVSEKIRKQSCLLKEIGQNEKAELLKKYISEVEHCDATNREGHAAKVYFNALFGSDFSRGDSGNIINSALNYGYSILLSYVNREICANGYLTQLGIFHSNMFNQFNLGCDLMEPFRVFVDRFVLHHEYRQFSTDEKHDLLTVFQQTVIIDDRHQVLSNALKIYVRSVFDALNEQDTSNIKFPYHEL